MMKKTILAAAVLACLSVEGTAVAQVFTKAQVGDRIRKVEDGVDEFRKWAENRAEDRTEGRAEGANAPAAKGSGRSRGRTATESQKAAAGEKKDDKKDELDDALGELNQSTNRLRRRFDPGDNWMERAFADIMLSPIITLRSGFPFNLFIGRDVNGDLNTTDRPFHAPRNAGVGENFYSVDLRMSKRFYLRQNAEGPRVEFIVEATNLFNHVNCLRVNDVVCGTTAQPGFINGCDPKFLAGPFDFRGIPASADSAARVCDGGPGETVSVRAEVRALGHLCDQDSLH